MRSHCSSDWPVIRSFLIFLFTYKRLTKKCIFIDSFFSGINYSCQPFFVPIWFLRFHHFSPSSRHPLHFIHTHLSSHFPVFSLPLPLLFPPLLFPPWPPPFLSLQACINPWGQNPLFPCTKEMLDTLPQTLIPGWLGGRGNGTGEGVRRIVDQYSRRGGREGGVSEKKNSKTFAIFFGYFW